MGAKIVLNGKLLQGTLDHPILVEVASRINGRDTGMSKKDKFLFFGAGAAAGIGYAISAASI